MALFVACMIMTSECTAAASSWFPSSGSGEEDSITSRVTGLPGMMYNTAVRTFGFFSPLFTYKAADDEPYPGFAYKRGREVAQVDEKGILLDLRTANGRKKEMLAPRRDRYDVKDSQQRDKAVELEEQREHSVVEMQHLLSKLNEQLRRSRGGDHGESSIDEDAVAKVKAEVHKKLVRRHQEEEKPSPEEAVEASTQES